jgi:hypothetical protein
LTNNLKKEISLQTNYRKGSKETRCFTVLVGLMNAKPSFLRYGSFLLNNGKQIRFWEDKWLGNFSFQQQYPSLFNIVQKRSDTIAQVLSTIPLRFMDVHLNDSNDVFKWNLHQNGQYSVHSLYLALINNGVVQRNTRV